MGCLCTHGVFPRCDNHQQQLFATWTGDAPPPCLVRLTLKISGGQKFLLLTSHLCRRPLNLCVRRAKSIAQHLRKGYMATQSSSVPKVTSKHLGQPALSGTSGNLCK